MKLNELTIVIRSGGEVGSAVAHRLYQSNFRKLCITEIENPNSVSRGVTFSEAVYENEKEVEGVKAKLITSIDEIKTLWNQGIIPLIIDPEAKIKNQLHADIFIDAIMAKKNLGVKINDAPLVIGIGPGFEAGRDVHMVIETNNSENLGKVLLQGKAEDNTGLPVTIRGYTHERVAHNATDGIFITDKKIGDRVHIGDIVASVGKEVFRAQINGMVRAILRSGISIRKGTKLFEIDPIADLAICNSIRSRMRSIAGGVMEAILMTYNKE